MSAENFMSQLLSSATDEPGIAIMPGPVVKRTVRCLVQGNFGEVGKKRFRHYPIGSKPERRYTKAQTDVEFWSYKKCTLNEYKKCVVKEIPGCEYDPDPDVVIQFSWKNKWDYEVAPMNDLTQRGGVGIGKDGPHLRFLIKVRFTSNAPTGLDIHKVPNDCTVDDVINGTNGAAHWVYKLGQSDVVLQMSPKECGFDGLWAPICPNFKLSMNALRAAGRFA